MRHALAQRSMAHRSTMHRAAQRVGWPAMQLLPPRLRPAAAQPDRTSAVPTLPCPPAARALAAAQPPSGASRPAGRWRLRPGTTCSYPAPPPTASRRPGWRCGSRASRPRRSAPGGRPSLCPPCPSRPTPLPCVWEGGTLGCLVCGQQRGRGCSCGSWRTGCCCCCCCCSRMTGSRVLPQLSGTPPCPLQYFFPGGAPYHCKDAATPATGIVKPVRVFRCRLHAGGWGAGGETTVWAAGRAVEQGGRGADTASDSACCSPRRPPPPPPATAQVAVWPLPERPHHHLCMWAGGGGQHQSPGGSGRRPRPVGPHRTQRRWQPRARLLQVHCVSKAV